MKPMVVNKYFYLPQDDAGGFTLLELLLVIGMVGIFAAIAAPSMLGLIRQGNVREAQNEVRAALSEAQQTAYKRSKPCQINFPASNTVEPTIASGNDCFTLGSRKLSKVKMRHNLDDVVASYNPSTPVPVNLFDFRGTTDIVLDDGNAGTQDHLVIVITSQDNDVYQKCVVVSDGLGLIRSGDYPRNDTTTDVTKCITR